MQYLKINSSPEIFKVEVPFPNISTNATNCYVVRDGEDALVIDSGAPTEEAREYLQAALGELGIDRTKASWFLTHLHLDHAGLVEDLVPQDATLYVNEREYHRTRPAKADRTALDSYEQFILIGSSEEEALMRLRMVSEASRYLESERNLVFVGEGDTIEIGAFSLEVVGTAGHTAGHISLFESRSGILFGGDHLLFVISPSIDYFSIGTSSFQVYLDNLKKVRDLPLNRLLPAHGEERPDYIERIDWLIEHHLGRLDEVLGIVKARPGLRGIEVVKGIKWNVPFGSWEEIPVIQRSIIITQGLVMLEHLKQQGSIECSKDGDGISCFRPSNRV